MKISTVVILSFCLLVVSVVQLYPGGEEEDLASCANQYMWDNLHQGNYDSIPEIINKLTEVKEKYPENAEITAHLGFVYLWSFAERARKDPDPSQYKNVFLSNHYFKDAIRLNPDDPRLYGFQSATDICEGALSKNYKLIMKGYANAFGSIKKWPQFNKFAISLVSSQLKKESPLYKLSLKYQWELIDDCSCRSLDRQTILNQPEKVFTDLIHELTVTRDVNVRRACWNSWIAPHNLEGFLLNFGDMLVKNGELKEAEIIYSAARLAPTYNEWVYKNVLEQRLKQLEENKVEFDKKPELLHLSGTRQIFINSEFSCMACHQMSKNEFEMFGVKSLAVSN
ncbi:MAG: hypothetical protein K0Q95_1724 [Bacteroidota bacterium]|jgi:hypothetical protein|nr:hypothetical protein [Bacteroidota bacterium]